LYPCFICFVFQCTVEGVLYTTTSASEWLGGLRCWVASWVFPVSHWFQSATCWCVRRPSAVDRSASVEPGFPRRSTATSPHTQTRSVPGNKADSRLRRQRENVASSTKPEVHNVSQRRRSRTEPLPRSNCVKNFVKFDRVLSEGVVYCAIVASNNCTWNHGITYARGRADRQRDVCYSSQILYANYRPDLSNNSN